MVFINTSSSRPSRFRYHCCILHRHIILVAVVFLSLFGLTSYLYRMNDDAAIYTHTLRDNVNITKRATNDAKTGTFNIIHITSLYKVKNCDRQFCPFDQDQAIAVASMSRARQESKKADVTLATSVFPEDGDAVPNDFIRLKDLSRSVATEYPQLNVSKKMPFANDIFDNLRSLKEFQSFDYVIYTNADIIVRYDFYNIVADAIQNGYDGFTINRQTLVDERVNKFTPDDLDEIYKLEGKIHPGTDCFVMTMDVFQQINMGDVFLGYAPFANMLFIQLQHYANRYRIFASNDLKATYHLSDDRSWETDDPLQRKLSLQNIDNSFRLTEVWPKICEFKVDVSIDMYKGNSLSCTRLAYKFWCEGYKPCKVARCTTGKTDPSKKLQCPLSTKMGQMYQEQSSIRNITLPSNDSS